MHYYKFHIGDYRKDTVHLSTIEHGIYRQLIDWYYLDEEPIPIDTQLVMRRLRLAEAEFKFLENVLADFFVLSKTGYKHKRIDAELKSYQGNAEKNRENGKKGGRPKKTQEEPTETQSVIFGNPDQSQNNPNHKLINHKNHKLNNLLPNRLSVTRDSGVTNALVNCDSTVSNDTYTDTYTYTDTNKLKEDIYTSTQENEVVIEPSKNHKRTVKKESTTEKTEQESSDSKPPYKLIMQMYNEILHDLPSALELNEARKKLMDGFWHWLFTTHKESGDLKATNEEEAIAYCQSMFEAITEDDFVMGRTRRTGNHQNWRATIDYILSPRGRTRCVEEARFRARQEQ